ncbi:hypothetical protein IGK30_002785 [Enterococcus sp. AZ178]|nr:hypothetical protein A5878_002346 [Enterococcus sp. 3G6_DIV0642]
MTVAVLGFTRFVMIMVVAVIVGKKMDEREGK